MPPPSLPSLSDGTVRQDGRRRALGGATAASVLHAIGHVLDVERGGEPVRDLMTLWLLAAALALATAWRWPPAGFAPKAPRTSSGRRWRAASAVTWRNPWCSFAAPRRAGGRGRLIDPGDLPAGLGVGSRRWRPRSRWSGRRRGGDASRAWSFGTARSTALRPGRSYLRQDGASSPADVAGRRTRRDPVDPRRGCGGGDRSRGRRVPRDLQRRRRRRGQLRRLLRGAHATARPSDPRSLPPWLVPRFAPYGVLLTAEARIRVSNEKARQDLGWTPTFPPTARAWPTWPDSSEPPDQRPKVGR